MTTIGFKTLPPKNKILDNTVDILSIPAGSFVKVIYHTEGNALNEYLIRTDDDTKPFVSLDGGNVWGTALDNYKMELLSSGSLSIIF